MKVKVKYEQEFVKLKADLDRVRMEVAKEAEVKGY